MTQSLKKIGLTIATAAGAVIVLLGVSLQQYRAAEARVTASHVARYHSYMLADELRQSSDDLTRLARTYVMSGDPKWESQYFEILDIRGGKKPRPNEYQRIYWDFRAADVVPPHGTGETVSLIDLMKRAGFSQEELGKLEEAAKNSNDLVRTETIAMNLVKGLTQDSSGQFTVKGTPDLPKAQALMHDAAYHQYKGKIMKPLDEFFVALDKRTQGEVDAAQTQANTWFAALIAIAMVSLTALGLFVWRLYGGVVKALGAAQNASAAIAQGDLVTQVHPQGPTEVANLLTSLQATRGKLLDIVSAMRNNAQQVATASSEIASGNQDLSQRTENQAAALQQTAATMDELSSTVRNNAENAVQASQLAKSAAETAVQGGEVVHNVVETMRGINDSSSKIAEIISVIDGIAFQTNILALNAAVEAARAGEQGRGFAVVASEVRSLAQRSADAAKEIKGLITASVEQVERGTSQVDQAGRTMQEIVAAIQRVSNIVSEISAASEEQSRGVQQVGAAVTSMDQATQQNAALVEQSAAAADSLKHQANHLVQAVEVFRVS